MEKLRAYLKALGTELARAQFAADCGTTLGYLRKAASTGAQLGAKLCSAIERNSGCQVRRWDLCPQDWAEIWPELAQHPDAPRPVPAGVGMATDGMRDAA